MSRFQSGEEAAFTQLYDLFKRPIYFFILTMTAGNTELSEELTHETFLKLYTKKDQFNHSVRFSTWFWTIARHTTIDELRKRNPIDYRINPPENENGNELDIPDHTQGLEEILGEKRKREKLQAAISKLPPRQREVILLRTLNEFEYSEIAEIMNIKSNAVKALINRAKGALIKILRKQTADNEEAS